VLILNSCDVEVYNNTFINTRAVSDAIHGWCQRSFRLAYNTGPGVEERDGHVFVNNLIVMEENYPKPQLYVWQPSLMCQRLNKPQLKTLDHNLLVRGINTSNAPMMLWSPADNKKCQAVINSPEELTALYPDF